MINDYRKTINEIIRRQNAQLPAAQQVLAYIETLMEGVSINQDMLIKRIERILSGEGQNDKNAFRKVMDSILGIFGLNVVSENERQKIGKISSSQEQQLLRIDRTQADHVISAIVSTIDDVEKNSTALGKRVVLLEERLTAVDRETERLRQERDAFQKDLAQKDRETLQVMQRILAQRPDAVHAGENEKDALMIYLEDMGVTWSWDDVLAPEDFITYKISDPAFVGVKQPCLYRDDKVALKGLRYVIEDRDHEDTEQ